MMKTSECVELFLSYIEDKSLNTVKNYKTDLNQFINVIGDKEITEITKVDIAKFRMFLQSKKRKSSTIARKLASLNSFFEYLIDMELLNSSPITKSHRPKISQKIPSSLSDEEIRKVLNSAETLMDKVILTIMLTTGLRSSELLSIKKEDILIEKEGKTYLISSIDDVSENDVAFIKVKGKGDKERVVPLSGKSLKYLFNYLNTVSKDRKVFPFSYKTLWRRITYIGEKAGVKLHPHKLRHTAATKALQSGTELRVIQELLGHASPITTARYAKVNQKQLVEATKALSKNIEL